MTDDEGGEQPKPVSADASEEDENEGFSNNYAMAIALGLPFGTALGLIVFDNIGLGAAIGLAFAPVIALLMGKVSRD